jgi:predicted  nucleic acid-binding Zn-ribbon protein
MGAEPPGVLMQEDIQYLLELSGVDKKVYELKQTKRDLPVRVQSLRDAIGKEKTNLERIQAAVADTQTKIRELQDTIAVETESLQESSKRLNNISTNREYDAIHLEIATHKKNVDTAQANILHFQQMLENLQKEGSEAEAESAKVLEANEPELNRLVEELNGIEDRITAQAKLGEAPRSKIGKKVLTLYDRIVQRRGTPNIIAAVNHSHRYCDVCSRSQTSQRVIEVSKKSTLLTCESCGSLLVWRDEIPVAV